MEEFFDKKDIAAGRDWEHTLHHGIARSRLFLAFISPNYFASDWCRREWRAWIDTEISKHILTEGVRPVYLVEVPGFTGKGALDEQAVAQKIAELCHLPVPHDGFLASTAPVVKQVRRRQLLSDFAKPYADEGLDALRREDLHSVLSNLAQDLDHHAQLVTAAASSETTVPPNNKKFSGRLDELLELRKRLKDDQAGVVFAHPDPGWGATLAGWVSARRQGKLPGMKRRTLRQLRPKPQPEQHHNVYVVLLDAAAGRLRRVRAENPKRNPKKPCVYVGMTGLSPEERFANHKAGIKAAAVVKRHGIRLLPELYAHLNPMPFEAAAQMETDLAEDLRREGCTVTGGH